MVNLRRVVLMMTVIVGAIVTVNTTMAPAAFACSCAGMSDEQAFERADAVFVGELRQIRRPTIKFSSADDSRFIFTVNQVYKGVVHATQSIVSPSDGASCGLEIDPGTVALVFAHSPDDGEYAAGLCDGTRKLGLQELLADFGQGTKPQPGSSPIGEDNSIPSLVVRNWYWVVASGAVVTAITVRRARRRRAFADTSLSIQQGQGE